MNIKSKVLNEIKLLNDSAKKQAEHNLSLALANSEFRKLYLEIKSLNFDISKLMFDNKPFEKLEKERKEKQRQAEECLKKLNLSFNDFEPQYSCKKCNDTGFVNGKHCECFNKKYTRELVNNVGINVDKSHTFENAKFEIFDNKEEMKKLYSRVESWCDKLSSSQFKNMLLSGGTGVGKTYLVESICNKLLKENVYVCFYSSFAINNLFLKFHTTFDESKTSLLDNILNCDVLVIDDLGTEPIFKNVTQEYFYLMANERLTKNKSTIITTNLTLDNLLYRYGERTFSRLCNKSNSLLVKMENKDLKLNRNK